MPHAFTTCPPNRGKANVKVWIFYHVALVCLACSSGQLNADASTAAAGEVEWAHPTADFLVKEASRITDIDSLSFATNLQTLGVRVDGGTPSAVVRDALNTHSRIVFVSLTLTNQEVTGTQMSSYLGEHRIDYLQVFAPNALRLGAGFSTLKTNRIRYLTVVAKGVTNIDVALYELTELNELAMSLGVVAIPNGMARLSELETLDLSFSGISKLPDDLGDTRVRCLRLAGIRKPDRLLVKLPKRLENLNVSACTLEKVPERWLQSDTLRYIDLSQNHLDKAPADWRGTPRLEMIGLARNRITQVPALKFHDIKPKVIDLSDNPVDRIDESNDALIQNGILLGVEHLQRQTNRVVLPNRWKNK